MGRFGHVAAGVGGHEGSDDVHVWGQSNNVVSATTSTSQVEQSSSTVGHGRGVSPLQARSCPPAPPQTWGVCCRRW